MPADRQRLQTVAEGVEPDALVSHLGTGGFASTFKVEKPGDTYALKIVDPTVAEPDRVQREVAALQRVDHPGVVRFRGYEEHVVDGESFLAIAMDFIDGHDLATSLAGGQTFTIEEAVQTVRNLVAAAGAIWAENTAHRDLSPRNILLTSDGRPVIVDLGMAKHVDDDTMTALPVPGTPGWMSPEQVGATPQHGDKRSDQFVLGCIAYLLLTGVVPFTGRNPLEAFRAPALQTPKPVRLLDPEIPSVVSDVVAKMMARAPHRRYLQTETLLGDLDRALIALQSTAPPEAYPQHLYVHVGQVKNFTDDDFLDELAPRAVVMELREQARLQEFADAARAQGQHFVLDPVTYFARSPLVHRPTRYRSLPFGSGPVLTGFSDDVSRRDWCAQVLETQMEPGPSVVVTPYFYAGESERNWLEESLACAQVHAELMAERPSGSRAEVWTGVSLHASWLANEQSRDLLLTSLTGQPMQKLYLLVATSQLSSGPLGDADVLRGLQDLIETMRDAGVRTVAAKRASSGLILLAFGAEGWGTGVAGNLMNGAAHPTSDEGGGRALDRIFVPSLLNLITVDTYIRMLRADGDRVRLDSAYAEALLRANPELVDLNTAQRQLLLRHNLTAQKQLVDELAALPVALRVRRLRERVAAAVENYAALPAPRPSNGEDASFLSAWQEVLR